MADEFPLFYEVVDGPKGSTVSMHEFRKRFFEEILKA
jgi:hypothetical protein